MHWKTDDKQWIEERKIEWKRLNARFLIDKETLGFEDSEIQYIKRYFLYGERELNNYDWWRALPLYLQFAYHPSDSHDIWLSIWQEYLSVFDLEWDSHVLSSLNSSYKDIRKLDSFVALTKYDSCSENDIFCGRQFQLFDFFLVTLILSAVLG